MAIRSGFFNSVNGDRKYDASKFAEYFASFIGNGVFPNPSTNLQVVAQTTPDMTVIARPGKAWINGYILINDDDYILQLDPADGVLHRIDRVVARYDTADREIRLEVKKGTFASPPVAPALQRDADGYELALGDIYVANGVISITQANITDQRLNSELCGIVHGTVEQVDTTTLATQYQTWFSETQTGAETDIDDLMGDLQSDWDTWFATVQEVLDGDTAGNLLNLINTNSAAIAAQADDLDAHLADDMLHVPTGLIAMWSGLITAIPNGWALCDGNNGTPDLRDRFIVGAGGDYNVGDTGGEAEVTLTTAQLPSHSHGSGNLSTGSAGSHSHDSGTLSTNSTGAHTHTSIYYRNPVPNASSGDSIYGASDVNSMTTTSAGSHSHTISGSTASGGSHSHIISGSTDSAGSGQAHENRPPYYALAFIMKL